MFAFIIFMIASVFAYALIGATLNSKNVTNYRVYAAIYFILGGIFFSGLDHLMNF